ncbi:MAG TPA: biosynthetic peptidoglycan transglycosylase [Anaeromyxobacter sp.]|nr:biosynthetic peptidoglycan transglycosylase [Anaeromyxobacter sp.]
MRRRHALIAAAAVLAAYAAAQAAVSTSGVRARLRARIEAALAPRFGDVAVPDARIDALFRVSFGPLALPLRPGGAPVARVERVRVRPALLALLRGRVEPAKVELRGATLSSPVAIGPLDADLFPARGAGGDRIAGAVRLAGGGRLALDVARGETGIAAHVRGEGIGPRDLPGAFRAPSAAAVAGALGFELDAQAASDLSRARGTFRITARGVAVGGSRIGPEPVGPLATEARGVAAWDGRTRRLSLRDATIAAPGGIPVALAGELRLDADLPFSLALRADRVDYAALVAGLPPSLGPPPAAPRPAGAFAARLEVSGPLAAPAAWAVEAALDLSGLRAAGRKGPPPPLAAPFVHHPDPADPRRELLVGPGNPEFVPLAELPEHVVRAVTTSEDAGFFGHSGFDFDELRNALAEGAEAGRVVRGGSTITQQVAKNLFLSQERTLARKVREAVIAIALEASLPKQRLLEIYLNVAEWGPGLWGIGPAARHWFGKDARELTAKEAAFLASIIPNPVRYHSMYERGSPSERWEAHVNDLLFKMTEQGALSDDQLVEGLEAPLYFTGG